VKCENWIITYINRTDYLSEFSQKDLACGAFCLIHLACGASCSRWVMKKSCLRRILFHKNLTVINEGACRCLQDKSSAARLPQLAALRLDFSRTRERFYWHISSHLVWPWRWRANTFENPENLPQMCGVSSQQWPSTQITLFQQTRQSAWLDTVTRPDDKEWVNCCNWLMLLLFFRKK